MATGTSIRYYCSAMLVLVLVHFATAERVTTSFDMGWKFYLGDHPGYTPPTSSCNSSDFPVPLNGIRCNGLHTSPATSAAACENSCCEDVSCEVWQWCNSSGECAQTTPCWIGSMNDCSTNDSAWISRGRKLVPGGFQPVIPGPQKCPQSPTCSNFDDMSWRDLNVPHDFVVEGTFSPNADRGHGYLPFNMSWYRKTFSVPPVWEGQNIWIDFDGVYRASDYWLNGVYLGHQESGYAPFRFYIHNATGVLNYGGKNILSVRVDALTHQEGWFYEGGGIYRHTKISSADPVSIVPWGVYAPSVVNPMGNITGDLSGPQYATTAIVSAQVDVANALKSNVTFQVMTTIYDQAGEFVVSATSPRQVLPAGGFTRTSLPLHWPSKPPQKGFLVQMAPCEGSQSQRFRLEQGSITTTAEDGSTLCLDSMTTLTGQKSTMLLQTCDSSKETQKWNFEKGTSERPDHIVFGGSNVTNGNNCLDVWGGTGPSLNLWVCASETNQIWTVVNDKTNPYVTSIGQCLSAVPKSQAELTIAHARKSPKSHTLANGDIGVPLWNLVQPYLFTIVTSTRTFSSTGGARNYTDAVNTTIGVRSAVFSPNQGFLLNGLPQKIKGLSMHQDFGGCGTAVPDKANEMRVTSLKKMGATGWRTAHNPVNSELLDYTDKYGMLVWSENRNLERQVIGLSDTPLGSKRVSSVRRKEFRDAEGGLVGAEWKGEDPLYLEEAQAMVLRDRNHPSIVIWSLCNEGGCMQGDPDGGYVATAFKNAIFAVDTSRPITANSEDTPGDTLTHAMDVNSFSYNYQEYDEFHIKYPFRTIIGGESASCTSDRSRYLGMGVTSNITTGYVDSDDSACVVSAWGDSAQTRPWVVGNFAWTGWDYKGEPTPSNWPAINSHFGMIDIAGFPKDSYYYYSSWWKGDTSVLHIAPQDWNSPVPIGHALNVNLYSAAAMVELLVNGVSQGKQSVPSFGVVTYENITFTPGSLQAFSWDENGKPLANTTVATTKAPSKIVLTIESDFPLQSNTQDVALVRVAIVDADGAFVASADNNITFGVQGPGSVYGVANGDPTDHDPDKATYRKVFKGLARVIIQSLEDPGQIVLTATATGLEAATLMIASV
eukprot:m.63229 g.63229  ORF g.63229 m.63229 type:complete len:1108 (-) comp23257_c0_seq2:128-3451(-)